MAILANLTIALAYVSIPVFLFYFWKKKRQIIPYSYLLLHFGLFITLCGITHLLDACMFWWPAYNLLVTVDVVTAIVSLSILIKLPAAVKYFMEWKTPGEYKRLAESYYSELKLERTLGEDLQNMIRLLEARIKRVESEFKHKGWVDQQTLELEDLQEKLDSLKDKYGKVFKGAAP
jgi:hypothetical protein